MVRAGVGAFVRGASRAAAAGLAPRERWAEPFRSGTAGRCHDARGQQVRGSPVHPRGHCRWYADVIAELCEPGSFSSRGFVCWMTNSTAHARADRAHATVRVDRGTSCRTSTWRTCPSSCAPGCRMSRWLILLSVSRTVRAARQVGCRRSRARPGRGMRRACTANTGSSTRSARPRSLLRSGRDRTCRST